jgi:hypothetical protein
VLFAYKGSGPISFDEAIEKSRSRINGQTAGIKNVTDKVEKEEYWPAQ